MPPEFIQPPKSTSIESPHESTLAVYMANRHQYIPHPQEEDDAIAHHGWRRHLASLMLAVAVVIPWGSAATPLPEAPAMSQVAVTQTDRGYKVTDVPRANILEIAVDAPPLEVPEWAKDAQWVIEHDPHQAILSSYNFVGLVAGSEQIVPEQLVDEVVQLGSVPFTASQLHVISDVFRDVLHGFREGLPSPEEFGKKLAEHLVEKGIDHASKIATVLAAAVAKKAAAVSPSSKAYSVALRRPQK